MAEPNTRDAGPTKEADDLRERLIAAVDDAVLHMNGGDRDELAHQDHDHDDIARAAADAVMGMIKAADAGPHTLQAAAREALEVYASHHKRHHPGAMHDPDCDVCRMGVPLSRALPRHADDREEIQARIDALRGQGGESDE